MYVIQVENNSGAQVGQVSDGATRIFGADRCQWQQRTDSNGGYQIANMKFYDGTTSAGVNYGVSGVTLTLGYIGKTGRFVAMTNPFSHS